MNKADNLPRGKFLNEGEFRSFLLDIEHLYRKKQATNCFQNPSLSKEIDSKLKPLYLLKQEYAALQEESREYEEVLKEVTTTEYDLLQEEFDKLKLEKKLLRTKAIDIISSEVSTRDNCLVEIRPGVGGVEAGLFARDLFQMYYKFAESKKWKIEVLENRADILGNLSFISFLLKGSGAFSYIKNEAGIHRVQRIPLTENKGRIQTSTTSVVVLPEVTEVAVKLENKDLRVDTYRSSGAGGQHVNTTDSAIRITHLPTGISAVSQDGRSQHDNKEKAFLILRSRLFEKYRSEQEGQLGSIRNSAIGNSERAEKIRTYNYPQNRVTDHRLSLTINKLNSVITGELEELCQKLIILETENKVVNFIKVIKSEASK